MCFTVNLKLVYSFFVIHQLLLWVSVGYVKTEDLISPLMKFYLRSLRPSKLLRFC